MARTPVSCGSGGSPAGVAGPFVKGRCRARLTYSPALTKEDLDAGGRPYILHLFITSAPTSGNLMESQLPHNTYMPLKTTSMP